MDFGGALALEAYRRHPTLPATLILAGGYAGWAGSLPADEVSRRLLFAERAADLFSTGRFQPRSMPGLFSATMPVDGARLLETIMADRRPVATRAMAHALAECNLNDMLSRITVPTLLLYGDADERSGPEVAKALNACIPTSSLSILPGMGHMGYLESPEKFDNAIRDFLHPLRCGGSDDRTRDCTGCWSTGPAVRRIWSWPDSSCRYLIISRESLG